MQIGNEHPTTSLFKFKITTKVSWSIAISWLANPYRSCSGFVWNISAVLWGHTAVVSPVYTRLADRFRNHFCVIWEDFTKKNGIEWYGCEWICMDIKYKHIYPHRYIYIYTHVYLYLYVYHLDMCIQESSNWRLANVCGVSDTPNLRVAGRPQAQQRMTATWVFLPPVKPWNPHGRMLYVLGT